MSSIESLELPYSAPGHTRLANLLAICRPTIQAEAHGERITLELAVAEHPLPRAVAIGLVAGDTRMRFDVAEPTFRRLSAPWGGDSDIGRLPPALRQAMLIVAMSPVLAALHGIAGLDFQLADEEVSPPAQALLLGLWPIPRPDPSPAAVLHLDDAGVALLSAALEGLHPAETAAPPPELPVELTLGFGSTRLAVGDLRTLEPGDVLLMAPGPDAQRPLVTIREAGRPLATAHLEGKRLVIERLVENPMTESQSADAGGSPDPTLSPDDIEIRLDFELGQLSLPLGELRSIQAGYSFELDVPAPGSVRILSGGRSIGRGELVRIGDRLGVRVTEIFKAPNG